MYEVFGFGVGLELWWLCLLLGFGLWFRRVLCNLFVDLGVCCFGWVAGYCGCV